MGIIKTGHKRFPRDYLVQWAKGPNVNRGNHKTVKTTLVINGENHPIFGVAWKDKVPKLLVCSRGVTLPGEAIIRNRSRVVRYRVSRELRKSKYQIQIERPRAIETYYDSFPTLDIHDHLRQGSLCLEVGWKTKTW